MPPLANAFGMIPVAARERYPALCAELGHVSMPKLEQTDVATAFFQEVRPGVLLRPFEELSAQVRHGPGMEWDGLLASRRVGHGV